MKILKKLSLVMFGLILCVGASFALSGCKDNKSYNQLYVFCTQGGYVMVEGQRDVVKNGDEGSKIFKIEEQTSIKLKAIPNNGYVFSEWEYAEGLNGKFDTFSHQAEINLISDEDVMVIRAVFSRVGENTFGFNFVNGEGYEIKLEAGYSSVIEKGNDVKFKVELKQGYDKSVNTMVVKSNGTVLTVQNGIYTISNVQDDIEITVENVTKNTYKATIPTDTAYIVNVMQNYDANRIVHGEDFKFYLSVNSGSAENFTVKVNGVVVSPVGSVYTVSNVTSDLIITVENGSIETYTVTPIQYTGITIHPTSNTFTVAKGANFEFTISAISGVDISAITVLYRTTNDSIGKVITPVNNKYTIENVNSDIQIQINNIVYSKFRITATDSRIDINPVNVSECLVEIGSNFIFTITIKEGYYISGGDIVVKANGNILTKDNGRYTITNVTEDQIITIEGIILTNSYSVTMPSSELFEIVKENGTAFTLDELSKVDYATDLKFKVKLNENCDGQPIVSVKNGQVLTANEGVYTISVKSNIEIVVSGLTIKKFNVVLPTVSGIEFTTIDGTVLSGNQQVEYGNNFAFKVNKTDSTISTISVEVDGKAISDIGGVYTITNIVSNKQITVTTSAGSYTINTINPLRGANFVIPNSTIGLGNNCEFSVVVDSKYNYDNIQVNSSVGTVVKGGRKVNEDGTVTSNFTLQYSAEIQDLTQVDLKIENVYFEFEWIIDYATHIGEYGDEASELPQKIICRVDIYDNLNTMNVNTDFNIYVEKADGNIEKSNIGSVINEIKDVYSNIGYEYEINQFTIRESGVEKTFIKLDADVVEINWSLINFSNNLYNIIVVIAE